MEEEKGSYIYVLFLFIGIALICCGAFYYFTSDKIVLNEDVERPVEEEVPPTIIKTSDIKEVVIDDGGVVTLSNGSTLKVNTSIRGTNNSLDVNDKSVAIINDSPGYKLYTILNEFLLIEVHTSTAFNHYYVVNSNARVVKDIYEMSNGTYAYKFENDKLTASRLVDGYSTLLFNSKAYNICDPDVISSGTIPADFVVTSYYNLVRYKNGSFGIELVKDSNVTLVEAQTSTCN